MKREIALYRVLFTLACLALATALMAGGGTGVKAKPPANLYPAMDVVLPPGFIPRTTPPGRLVCPVITVPALGADNPQWPSTHGTQTGRMTRDGIPSVCGAPKPACPGVFDPAGSRTYDAYQFDNDTGAPACVTVTINTACTATNYLFLVVYLGAYNPADMCANYLADSGSSPDPAETVGFDLPAGATATVVVHEVTPAAGCATGYTLTVTGIGCTSGLALQNAAMADVCSSGGPGSGDGILDPGENATFRVTLRNSGTTAITGITGALSCPDPLVTVGQPNASWPDLASMATAPNDLPDFGIYLSPAATCGTVLPFTLDLTANEGTWSQTFDVSVGSVTHPTVDLINESFSAWPPSSGGAWTFIHTGCGGWEDSSVTGYTNNTGGTGVFADANSDWCGTAMDASMVTPPFDLSLPAGHTAELEFKSDYYDLGDEAYVDVTTDGATWTNLLTYLGASARGPRTMTLDLTPYIGNPAVQVRFRYVAYGWDWWWQVDDVVVRDMGYSCAMNPCAGGTCTVTCSATATPTTGTVPLAVTFASTVTVTGCIATPTYAWDFGDGGTSTEANPAHTYLTAGNYTWTLTVTAGTETCITTGTVSSQPFDLTLWDDTGRSYLCLNSSTGAFSYTVVRGAGVGSYAGMAKVVSNNGVLTATTAPGLPYGLNLRYQLRYYKATASYTNRPARVSSTLTDSNTRNNPAVCAAP